MKALSCAIMFLACVLALWGITYEEIHNGKDLRQASAMVGLVMTVAAGRWWYELRPKRKDNDDE